MGTGARLGLFNSSHVFLRLTVNYPRKDGCQLLLVRPGRALSPGGARCRVPQPTGNAALRGRGAFAKQQNIFLASLSESCSEGVTTPRLTTFAAVRTAFREETGRDVFLTIFSSVSTTGMKIEA